MTRYLTRDSAAVAAAVMGPLALAAVLLPWRGSWSNSNVALLLVVAVVAIACLGNRFAGALAAVSAAVWFDFFFTVPYNELTISRSADVTTFVLLLAVGVAVSQLAARARRLKAVTVADAGYFTRIVSSAVLTQQAGTPYDVVEHVRRQLIEVLGLQDCRFEYGKLLGQPPRLEPDGSVRTLPHYPTACCPLPATLTLAAARGAGSGSAGRVPASAWPRSHCSAPGPAPEWQRVPWKERPRCCRWFRGKERW